MPKLKSAKREAYCRARAEGETISRSYERANYSGDRGNASHLEQMADIQGRIAELKADQVGRQTFNAKNMSGLEIIQYGAERAALEGDHDALISAGKALGPNDGSFGELTAKAKAAARTDSELAYEVLPLFRSFLEALKRAPRDEDKMIHAILLAMGKSSAHGFQDHTGQPIPIDPPKNGADPQPN